MRKNASTGRDVIDSVVVDNQSRNPQLFNEVKDLPTYYGCVNIGEKKFGLTPIRNRNRIGKLPIIQFIIDNVENFTLKNGVATISKVEDGVIVDTTEVHPMLIKVIKVCAAASYSPNEDFSIVLTEFVKELNRTCKALCLPIDLPRSTATMKIVGLELNTWLKDLCDENDIRYTELVEAEAKPKLKKTKAHPMVEAAKKSGDV